MVATLHAWHLTPDEAERLQADLASRLILHWDDRPVTCVGGVDVSIKGQIARCAVVVLRYPDLTVLTTATAVTSVTFPYIPGLLAFREGPAVLMAWEQLEHRPDLLLFDGQGIAHPRRLGIAAHMGLWLDCPTIGVAKSRLYGRHQEPGPNRGDRVWLYDERDPGQVIGAVVRTRAGVRPVYVSPGHRMDISNAVAFVLACCRGFRLPEPTRWAHRLAGGAGVD